MQCFARLTCPIKTEKQFSGTVTLYTTKTKLYAKNRFHDESGISTASHFLSAI